MLWSILCSSPFSVHNLGNFGANSIFGHHIRDNLNMTKILVQPICINMVTIWYKFQVSGSNGTLSMDRKELCTFSVPSVKFGRNF